MREHKYKAWDTYSKCWLLYFEISPRGLIFQNNIGRANALLVEYTGLHDKNGKEIYEGDIVKRTKAWEVLWMGYGWWLRNIKDGASFPLGRYEVYEVIGNIYENPELLEEK